MIAVFFLFIGQTPIDFADYLYFQGDYRRAALEYERIGYMDINDSNLASYALLQAGEALLKTGEPIRAARIYSEGINKLSFDAPRFTYGLVRSEYARNNFKAVDSLASRLDHTELEWKAQVYQTYSLIFLGDTGRALVRLSSYEPGIERDSTIMLLRTPLNYRSPFLTAAMSLILPGAGQAVCGRWGDAWQSFSITALMAGAGVYYLAFSQDSTTSNTVKGVVFCSLGGLFWLGNIYGAANAALDYNDFEKRKRDEQYRNLMAKFDLEPEIKRP